MWYKFTVLYCFLFWLKKNKKDYVGCFRNDHSLPEFNSFASHLSAPQLTPALCIKACVSVGFNMSAIKEATRCFCKSGVNVLSLNVTDDNCMSQSCPGDSTLACGSYDFMLVYKGYPSIQVLNYRRILLKSLARSNPFFKYQLNCLCDKKIGFFQMALA